MMAAGGFADALLPARTSRAISEGTPKSLTNNNNSPEDEGFSQEIIAARRQVASLEKKVRGFERHTKVMLRYRTDVEAFFTRFFGFCAAGNYCQRQKRNSRKHFSKQYFS